MGFSTSTGLPSSKALRIGGVCCCSGVETITAVTCGWLITSSLLPLWTSAPASAASARARGIAIGDRQEPDGGMLGGKPRAQRANAPGADDRNADIVLLLSQPPKPS